MVLNTKFQEPSSKYQEPSFKYQKSKNQEQQTTNNKQQTTNNKQQIFKLMKKANSPLLTQTNISHAVFRVYFNKLIGSYYTIEQKMVILDWMLKTGKPFRKSVGRWTVKGVSQLLFAYSANDYDYDASIPCEVSELNNYYDAIFARAVYKENNMEKWRKSENIFPDKYRILKINNNAPVELYEKYGYLQWLINDIFKLNGKELKKEYHHPDYKNRLTPKIIWIKIYTIGTGWIVTYGFSFKCFKYEDGWEYYYRQKENQSLWEFFGETLNDLQKRCLKTDGNVTKKKTYMNMPKF